MNRITKSVAVAACAALVGCAALLKTVPADMTTAECIIADAAKGENVSQIASDPACKADLATVVTTLLSSSDSKVKASAAYRESVGLQQGLSKLSAESK